ncbi:MAG: hypothetical protein ACI89L_002312 [Phycisphaerales bacterium]|jgi:hypothetical protein
MSKPSVSKIVAICAPAILFSAGTALAQPSTDRPTPDELGRSIRHISSSLTLGTHILDNTDMDDGGEVSVTRVFADSEIVFPIGDASSITLDLGLEHSNYDFNSVFIIPDTDNPVTQVNTYSARAVLTTPFDHGKMALLVGAGIKLAGEFDADVGESLTYNTLAGIVYNHDPKISFGLGVIVASQLEDDPLIVPFPILRYQFDDRWSLTTDGPTIELAYDYSQELNFGLYLSWENRSYRLESGTGLSSNAVVNENRVPVGFYATFSPGPGLEIRGDVFSSVYTKFEARSDNEAELGNEKADPGLGFGISAIFRF